MIIIVNFKLFLLLLDLEHTGDSMKKYIKTRLKAYLSKQEVTIEATNNFFVFKINKTLPFFQNYLIIKHKESKKRISKKIKNKKVELFKEEISELLKLANPRENDNLEKNNEEFETLNIFLKNKLSTFEYIKRASSREKHETFCLEDEKNKVILRSYQTIGFNHGFFLKKQLFSQKIENIKNEDNELLLEGSLKLFENIELDQVEICAENKETYEKRFYNCEISKNQNLLNFRAKIDFKISEKDIDSFWKLSIRIKNKGFIIDESLLHGDILYNRASFEKKMFLIKTESLFIEKSKESLKVVSSLYLFKNFLRLSVHTEKKWLELFKKAKHKTLFEKHSKNKLDKSKIFFESFHGNSYSHNPKYIYEQMLKMGYDKKFTFVWSYSGKLDIPGNPIIVNRECDKYYEELASSKYWVNNISFPVKKIKKDIVYIQTTHGTPLKHMGEDIQNESPKTVKGNIVLEAKKWNYLISPNHYAHEIFKRAFKYKKNIIDTGYPANDIFYEEINKKVNKIKEDLKINSEKKIILFAPTFRDTERDIKGDFCFNLSLDLKKLFDKFNDDHIILLRLHYLIASNINIDKKLKKFAIDVSNYDDIHELLLISDLLITDYSSVFFDYAHSKRPILFFMPDIKDYEDNIRGFYLDIKKDLPGPIFMNEDDLIDGVKNISKINEEFKDRYEKFYNSYCYLGHGNASEKLIKIVFEGKK